jgi:mono/diheme cytochrome c family protein
MKRILSFALLILVLGIWSTQREVVAQTEIKFSDADLKMYEQDVLPVLKQHCYKCHAGDKIKGGLNMTTRTQLLEGGDSGKVINLDKPLESMLIKAINYGGEYDMPPSGKLPDKERAILTKWVHAKVPMPFAEPMKKAKAVGGVINDESKNYWAYKPVQNVAPPKVKHAELVKNPIDAFILQKQESKGLKLSAIADRKTLVRRAYYDLLGLAPSPEEVERFINDPDPKAYAKLIDHLLESPHYGEKWGRFWMDIVHYAETNGYERDGEKPNAWRYRDYVIQSLNADKPYNQFLREQLAGDELPGENRDAIIATGFYRLGTWDDEPADPAEARALELDDYVTTVGQAFLGMTMNCARCHDHKIDPIPQSDYYRLVAFFQDIQRYSGDRNVRSSTNQSDISPPEKRKVYESQLKKRQERLESIKREMEGIENVAIKKMNAEDQRASEGIDRPQVVRKVPALLNAEQGKQYKKLQTERKELEKVPEPDRDLALSINNCLVNPPETHIFIRGNPGSKGAVVKAGFPAVLGAPEPTLKQPAPNAKSSGRRSVLADWITSRSNPLTARVMANRLWQGHFGRGIVGTPNDFGKFGEAPTHPELLDWLATQFMESGWKIKAMHRLIMLSATYQQVATGNAEGLKTDPSNSLLWRFNMRRLTAEEVRDSILAVSGKLNMKQFGPSIFPPIPKAVLAGQSVPGQGWHTTHGEEANRRSVYVHIKRSLQVPILIQHDQADPDTSCPVRYTTTVPTQSLGMLNGEFTNEQAGFLAERLQREGGLELAKQVRTGIRLTTGREPTQEEINQDIKFMEKLKSQHNLDNNQALKQFCLMLLNANEFVYLD